MSEDRHCVPRATYRLQLHGGFDFGAARAVLPYLHRLGISHVYCSPIFTARPGSLHGYDVVDPTRINPELGGRAGFERFAAEARALGLGILLDVVPNHMSTSAVDNAWWADVLENGKASAYESFFDIDWTPANPALRGKLMVPVLALPYGKALDAGQIAVVLDAERGRLALACGSQRFPLDPQTYPLVLGEGSALPSALVQLSEAFGALPARDDLDLTTRELRHATQRELQARLALELGRDPAVADAIGSRIESLNAAASRDALDALHEAQAFRLVYWRSAADDVNYRRFFDVNDLVAVRVEDEAVFEATQGLALDLAADGWIDGLRIDHPDGLFDPAEYFARLQRGMARRQALDKPANQASPLYVVAEKIMASHEELPANWAVHGATGYRFANLAGGLFVERRNAGRLERIWRAFTGIAGTYDQLMRESRRKAARETLSSQLTGLANALQRVALTDRYHRDHGFNSLRDAIVEVAVWMPVYRTYVPPTGEASAQDRRFIDWAVARAYRASDPADAALYEFLRRSLLAETDSKRPDVAAQVRDFALRFQQFSSPVAAKGVEDTAFYRYQRLVSLNEVGGDPDSFGISAGAFHAANAHRARHWPHTLLATSTHDNKRSEDVRARINVLSERPAEWKLAQRHWRISTRGWRSTVAGAEAPSRADQFLLHQTLLGTLPAEGLAESALPAFRERIREHMLKAAREAKTHTSWASHDPLYEEALTGFVDGLLGRVEGNAALQALQARAAAIAWHGALNSLSLTLLKLACPGVPDIYQGTELIDLSLVDPDNRRPVDFAARGRILEGFESISTVEGRHAELQRLATSPTDGRLKLWLIWRLLTARRLHRALFDTGDYVPLRVTGERRRHVIAFARRGTASAMVVVAGRKFTGLDCDAGRMPVGADVWGDTTVQLPRWVSEQAEVEELLTGARRSETGDALLLASTLSTVPISAILTTSPTAGARAPA